jgi:hypothetical protein
MAINDVIKELAFEKLVGFVKLYIVKEEITPKIAAMTVFSSMIETMPKSNLQNLVNESFMTFVGY